MKKYFKNSFFIFLFLSIVIFETCDDSGINAPQDFISGTVIFTDTILRYNGGYYAVSLFPDNSSPFSQSPLRNDSLKISISNGVASTYYKMDGITSGSYYVGITWIRSSDGNVRGVLGTYGCDTTHNCTASKKVTVPSYSGTGGINILSWTDTLRKVF
jgi:hypothetical protein